MGACPTPGRIAALHANVPNMLGQITAILAKSNANIQRMMNEAQNDSAYTLIDLDKPVDADDLERLRAIPGIYRIRVIKPAQ